MEKNLPANAGNIRDAGSIPGSGRVPGKGNGNRLQYSCLENLMEVTERAACILMTMYTNKVGKIFQFT